MAYNFFPRYFLNFLPALSILNALAAYINIVEAIFLPSFTRKWSTIIIINFYL